MEGYGGISVEIPKSRAVAITASGPTSCPSRIATMLRESVRPRRIVIGPWNPRS